MSTHHGFIKEFPFIRVDAFHGEPAQVNPYSDKAPHFYLLTHAHTDHIVGLNSPQFEGEIYCTSVTKHILLNTTEAGERVRQAEIPEMGKRRKFANLWRTAGKSGRAAKDLIKEICVHVPTTIQGPDGPVTVTAIDANHCPGSCMFLIEGVVDSTHRAVLVTGDIRAEPWWVEALQRNPLLSKYTTWAGDLGRSAGDVKGKRKATEKEVLGWGREAASRQKELWPGLDCIYLDTSAVLLNEELVSKKEAVTDLVRHMALYPPETKFFLNSWTWGYEEMLKGVAQAFNTKIHFDRYKQKMYADPSVRASDPLLSEIGTLSSAPLRFHACERRWKCDQVWADGRGVLRLPRGIPATAARAEKVQESWCALIVRG